jgi:hypothetical protein
MCQVENRLVVIHSLRQPLMAAFIPDSRWSRVDGQDAISDRPRGPQLMPQPRPPIQPAARPTDLNHSGQYAKSAALCCAGTWLLIYMSILCGWSAIDPWMAAVMVTGPKRALAHRQAVAVISLSYPATPVVAASTSLPPYHGRSLWVRVLTGELMRGQTEM